MTQKPNFLKLLTDTFDEISHDNSVDRFHNCVTDVVPGKFNGLIDCELISNLLAQIATLTNNLKEKADNFKSQIDIHKDAVVSCELNLSNNLENLSSIEIATFDGSSNYG